MLAGLDYPLWYYALASLTLFVSLLIFGGPVISLVSEIYGAGRKKVLATKFAQHCDRLSTGGLILALLLAFLSFFLLIPATRWYPLPLRISQDILILLAAIAGTALFFWVVRSATWKPLKKKKGIHITLGILQVLALLALFFMALSFKAKLLILPAGESLQIPGQAALIGWSSDSLFWPVLVQVLLKAIGLSAAVALVYLLWRRNKDDFGRDYYNWSVTAASKWALIFLLGQLVVLPWYYLLGFPLSMRTLYAAGGSILALFLGGGVWLLLIRSKTPLRYKGMIFLSLVLLWASLTLQLMVADTFLPTILQ